MKKEENQKVSEGTPKLGLETVTENVTDSKAKAEQEAKEKAEQEAKAKAEQEAKEKAEQEAKAKAEQEAKEKAEQEAKAKAEQEAKEKAEKETKADNPKVWIRAILPLAGKFFMSHDPGHEFQHDKNQAEVIVEAGYAELLTPEEIAEK